MHGLVNRSIERFIRDTYGNELWLDAVAHAGVAVTSFEAMMSYDAALTNQVLAALADRLSTSQAEILEDIGTYLVSSPTSGGLRRLLRFSGSSFVDFLFSLDDLPARARLALPDMAMPQMELREHGHNGFLLNITSDDEIRGLSGPVVLGVLRAMADDYGALAVLDHRTTPNGPEMIEITLLEATFAEARAFELGAQHP